MGNPLLKLAECFTWEQTDHFAVCYREPIALLVDNDAGIRGERNEKWLGLLEEAMMLFWEEWANRPDVYKFWKDHIKRKQTFLFETVR